MRHKIIEAIIENGQLKLVNKKLPRERMKVHIVYDILEETPPSENEVLRIVRETSGIYKGIDEKTESKKLRKSWEQNVHR